MTNQQAAEIVLTATVLYREARGQPYVAILAVAFSIMERAAHPGWWGNSVLSVLFHPMQYSSVTNKADPQLRVWPMSNNDPAWLACLNAASVAYEGDPKANPAPGATSYYDVSIPAPVWATDDLFVTQIGKLRFYRVAV